MCISHTFCDLGSRVAWVPTLQPASKARRWLIERDLGLGRGSISPCRYRLCMYNDEDVQHSIFLIDYCFPTSCRPFVPRLASMWQSDLQNHPTHGVSALRLPHGLYKHIWVLSTQLTLELRDAAPDAEIDALRRDQCCASSAALLE